MLHPRQLLNSPRAADDSGRHRERVPEEKEMLVETGPAVDPNLNTTSVTSVQVKDNHRSRDELEETTAGSDYTGTVKWGKSESVV